LYIKFLMMFYYLI